MPEQRDRGCLSPICPLGPPVDAVVARIGGKKHSRKVANCRRTQQDTVTKRGFLADTNYKVLARDKLNETVPVAAAASGTGYIEGVVAAFESTNLIDPRWERPPLIKAMHSADGNVLVKHLASFALGERSRLPTIAVIYKKHKICRWPIVTYLPFLWETDNENVILRHEPTNQFAVNVGHPFSEVYESDLSPEVYESLLDLFTRTRNEIANLNPRDMIDVQSFVWVVSKYDR